MGRGCWTQEGVLCTELKWILIARLIINDSNFWLKMSSFSRQVECGNILHLKIAPEKKGSWLHRQVHNENKALMPMPAGLKWGLHGSPNNDLQGVHLYLIHAQTGGHTGPRADRSHFPSVLPMLSESFAQRTCKNTTQQNTSSCWPGWNPTSWFWGSFISICIKNKKKI